MVSLLCWTQIIYGSGKESKASGIKSVCKECHCVRVSDKMLLWAFKSHAIITLSVKHRKKENNARPFSHGIKSPVRRQPLLEMLLIITAENAFLHVFFFYIGFWHPISPKLCTVCVGSGGLSPRELVKRTQCQLSALRHLQQQLITQVITHPQELSQLISLSFKFYTKMPFTDISSSPFLAPGRICSCGVLFGTSLF